MKTRLLKKVAEHIKEEPRRLDMEKWTDVVDPVYADSPPCGTVGCIAGWACMLNGDKPTPGGGSQIYFFSRGQELLGLTKDQADRLFTAPALAFEWKSAPTWPKKFARRYEKAKTPKGRASATLARIEHFIATKGRE